MNQLTIKLGTAAMSLAAGIAILGPSSAAVADTAAISMSIQTPATLLFHGAAVSVPVVVSCPAGTLADLSLGLHQSVGKRIASGFAQTQISCTGSPETIVMTVLSDNVAFSKAHSALASGGVFGGCGDDGCLQTSDSASIKIK